MEIIRMILIIDQNGFYSKAIIEFRDEYGSGVKRLYSSNEIQGAINDFAIQENMNSLNFLHSDKVVTIYDSTEKLKDNYQRQRRSERWNIKNEKPYTMRSTKPLVINTKTIKTIIITAGVITIIGVTAFVGANYKINRDNIYNNKHVISQTEYQMPNGLYELLKNYDSFEENMYAIIDNDYEKVKNIDLSQFHKELDTILETNNSAFQEFYNSKKTPKKPLYTINFSSYFKEGTYEYNMIKKWENEYNMVVDYVNRGKYSLFCNAAEFIAKTDIIMLYGKFFEKNSTNGYDSTFLGSYAEINRLSPLAKYCIYKMAYPFLEMTSVHYKYSDTTNALEKANNQLKNFENSIRTSCYHNSTIGK